MTTLATRTCSICYRAHVAKGLCRTHYDSWRKRGELRVIRRRLPILEVLELEGGWWTVEGLACRLNAKEDSVKRHLVRLWKAGKVDKRTIPRWEWRAL